ncbi:FAS1-like dehydratase domain-containing protein [Chitinasiproducens palmae]|uniref:3-methylfumaryl-CoA hydratase n=1 Tax=Chitinasiproducens palmae TaxID=1770053 RepID=A0A1H2PLD0_9BURK|nr:MaoC family dehydratase N-terminal domain-containing protein [Chitinasiproducens palmae]SDV47216.1 3-methylfumaryl-CoA hydratase [Chitinasiproducens palmae]
MTKRLSHETQRIETAYDTLSATHAAALSATLDYPSVPVDGDLLPPLWHWTYFTPLVPQSSLAEDGHPHKGGFLPELNLPRRMWAGGRLRFHVPLMIGEQAMRESRVGSISKKQGRSGRLAFVTVQHRITGAGALAIEEEHDIVYRELATAGSTAPAATMAPAAAYWRRTLVPDETLLFRYSALTFNAHRIHYDKPYVTGVEGYPGLVVHGPLIATLLIDLIRRSVPDARIAGFSFKAVRPSFAGLPLELCGQPSGDGATIDLWSMDHEGLLGMTARAALV